MRLSKRCMRKTWARWRGVRRMPDEEPGWGGDIHRQGILSGGNNTNFTGLDTDHGYNQGWTRETVKSRAKPKVWHQTWFSQRTCTNQGKAKRPVSSKARPEEQHQSESDRGILPSRVQQEKQHHPGLSQRNNTIQGSANETTPSRAQPTKQHHPGLS